VLTTIPVYSVENTGRFLEPLACEPLIAGQRVHYRTALRVTNLDTQVVQAQELRSRVRAPQSACTAG
jgi:hypothetical protein